MNFAILDNETKNHLETITKGMSKAKTIFICTAFLKMSGLSCIKTKLVDALEKGASAKIIVGLDFYLTSPDALWDLYELAEKYKKLKFLICLQATATFHPKLYCWIDPIEATVIV